MDWSSNPSLFFSSSCIKICLSSKPAGIWIPLLHSLPLESPVHVQPLDLHGLPLKFSPSSSLSTNKSSTCLCITYPVSLPSFHFLSPHSQTTGNSICHFLSPRSYHGSLPKNRCIRSGIYFHLIDELLITSDLLLILHDFFLITWYFYLFFKVLDT